MTVQNIINLLRESDTPFAIQGYNYSTHLFEEVFHSWEDIESDNYNNNKENILKSEVTYMTYRISSDAPRVYIVIEYAPLNKA